MLIAKAPKGTKGKRSRQVRENPKRVVVRWNQQRFFSSIPQSKPNKLIKLVQQRMPGVSSNKKVPDLEMNIDLAQAIIEQTGGTSCIQQHATLRSHVYVVAEPLASLKEISRVTGVPIDTLKKLIAYPTFFLDAWFLNVPFGGARLISLPPLTTSPEQEVELFLMGTNQRLLSDPIGVKKMGTQMGQRISLPNVVAPTMGIHYESLLHSFLAQTMWGHALTGSVSHNLLLFEDILHAIWIGAGAGPPFLGGHFNNIVACNEHIGTWPWLASNMKEALHMPIFWRVMAEIQNAKTPEAKKIMLMQLAQDVSTHRPLRSRVGNSLGIFHTSLGAPVRMGSKGLEQILRLIAWYHNEPMPPRTKF